MNTWELIAWLSSAVGAGLFFAAGRLTRGPAGPTAVEERAPNKASPVAVVAAPPPPAAEHQAALQEREALRQELERLRHTHAQATRRDAALLEERARLLAGVQAQVADQHREIQDWRQRLSAAEGRLRTPAGPRDSELALQAEVSRLRAENDSLRTKSVAARPAARLKPLALNVDGMSRGSVLQSLVERVSRLADIRCSVVADDLGLVVASHGELADEVAAVGALFSRAGQQAQQVLSLQNVERVTVEDSLGMVLALRPLSTDRYGDPDLSLITLAVGAGPDQRQVNMLIDESPRAAVSP